MIKKVFIIVLMLGVVCTGLYVLSGATLKNSLSGQQEILHRIQTADGAATIRQGCSQLNLSLLARAYPVFAGLSFAIIIFGLCLFVWIFRRNKAMKPRSSFLLAGIIILVSLLVVSLLQNISEPEFPAIVCFLKLSTI